MRTSSNIYKDGQLWQGFDYEKQEWIFEGKKDTRTLEQLQESAKTRYTITKSHIHKDACPLCLLYPPVALHVAPRHAKA